MNAQNTQTSPQEGSGQAEPGGAGQNTPISSQEALRRAKRTRPMSYNPNHETRKVKIWGKEYEIPAHMDMASMIEIWKDESDWIEALVKDIVQNHIQFAWAITSEWLTQHHQFLIDEEVSDQWLKDHEKEITAFHKAVKTKAFREAF